jgi:hypothetical protein
LLRHLVLVNQTPEVRVHLVRELLVLAVVAHRPPEPGLHPVRDHGFPRAGAGPRREVATPLEELQPAAWVQSVEQMPDLSPIVEGVEQDFHIVTRGKRIRFGFASHPWQSRIPLRGRSITVSSNFSQSYLADCPEHVPQ